MPLILNEEQRMLKQSAAEFLTTQAPVQQQRRLRDSKDATGYDLPTWQEMATMGWTAMTIPEEYDGLGFGYTGLGQILEETGRTLTASPLFSTVVLGASAILYSDNQTLKSTLLPGIAAGKVTVAFAHEEGHTHKALPSLAATRANGGYTLEGTKRFVIDGHTADYLIVTALTNPADKSSVGLFLVKGDTEGVKIETKRMMDSRLASQITFNAVTVPADARIDDQGGIDLLTKVLDIGRIALSAEMYGLTREAFERTMAYLKERKQFGVAIGSFQALQHRASHMFCELELCKTLIIKSLHAIDEGVDLRVLASMTKSKMGEVAQLVTNEAIQMYGGIGVTDDEDIGLFMKRARVAQQTLGDYNFHLERFATLKGF